MNVSIDLPVRIVMVEDDEGHARLIERNIRRAGVHNEIVPFTMGREALKFVVDAANGAKSHLDVKLLVLLDLNLPDISGLEILRLLKSNERTRRIPIIVLTTTDDRTEIAKCYELGCSAYVKKPLEYNSFANSVRQLGLFFSIIELPPT